MIKSTYKRRPNGKMFRYKSTQNTKRMWVKHHLNIKAKHLLYPKSGSIASRILNAKLMKDLWVLRFK